MKTKTKLLAGILGVTVVGIVTARSFYSKSLENLRGSVVRRADAYGNLNRRLDENEEQEVLNLVGSKSQTFCDLSTKQLRGYHDEVDRLYGIDYLSPRFQEELTRKFGPGRYGPEAVLGGM